MSYRSLTVGRQPPGLSSGCAARYGGWADEGIIETSLLDRARPQQSDDRLVRLIAGIKAAGPIAHSSRLPHSSKPCGDVHREAERDGIPLRSSICWPVPNASA